MMKIMNKKHKKAFNQLWKVKALNQIKEFDKDGRVTRDLESDYEMKIKMIAYGFLEGINYVEEIVHEN